MKIMRPICLLAALALMSHTCEGGPPNIVFFLVDDLGYGDMQYTDSLMRTPHAERLREEGMFLNQSYVLPMCAPTRGALLSGRYPHTYGLQDGGSLQGNKLFWLDENLTLLPQELQSLGYTTHMLGKWHLGFCHPGLLPLARGFHTFYGMWLGMHNSTYNHSMIEAYDWWDQDQIDLSANGTYSTELITTRAVRIVEDPQLQEPFFMYVSHQAVHSPFEVPQRYIDDYCSHVTNASRQIHCGMTAAVDESLGNLTQALKDKGIYDNTVVVFMSDNGGPVKDGSVNYPLRSGKKNLFEGGVRAFTILKAPKLSVTNVTWPGLVTAIDWMPTLIKMAGGQKPSYVHGKNLWWKMKRNEPSSRTDFIINVSDYPKFNHIGFRLNKWKYIGPMPGLAEDQKWQPGFQSGWYPPYQLLEAGEPWEHVKGKYNTSQYFLFNIEEDPYERKNLEGDPAYDDVLQQILNAIDFYVGNSTHPGKYPVQPTEDYGQGTGHKVDGVYATCWCQPAGLADSNACPSQ